MIATVLCVVLLLLFLGITSGAMQCIHQSQFGVTCTSCGVSRDLMRYMCLDFSNPLKPDSLKIDYRLQPYDEPF